MAVLVGACTVVSAAPRIELVPELWNVGELNQQETKTTKVEIRNTGDEPLVIAAVKDGCGACTRSVVEDRDRVIQPGQSAPLTVTFFARNYRGRITRTVQIVSNDTQSPTKLLTVVADVKDAPQPRMEISERVIDVGILSPGATKKVYAEIQNAGEADLLVQGFKTSDHVRAQVEGDSRIPPGQSRRVSLEIGPFKNTELGVIKTEYARIFCNDPNPTSSFVQFTGYVAAQTPAISIVPKGEPAQWPNSAKEYWTEYEVTNSTSVPVVLDVRSSAKAQQDATEQQVLKPGESTVVHLQPGEDPEQVMRVSLQWPVAF